MSAGAQPVPQLVDHLFRRESARLVAGLTRVLGVANIDLAEEVVQDSLLTALRVWPYRGVPDNPAAWLTRVARNRAVDLVRRERSRREYAERLAPALRSEWTLSRTVGDGLERHEIDDDQLRLIFTCCHPSLPEASRVALTLRLLCGLTAEEIGRAFLQPADTVRKRLFRARRTLGEGDVPFEVPDGAGLAGRLDSVITVLYLLFNEGANAPADAGPLRRELCDEALRLVDVLRANERLATTPVHALAALFRLQAARLATRVADDGSLRLLEQQDRTRWDREQIEAGLADLARATACRTDEHAGRYELEAAIAACHAVSPSFEATDWGGIVTLYDALLRVHPTPVVALNRAVALGHAEGAEPALEALAALERDPSLARYHLLPATAGEFLFRAGRLDDARRRFERARELAPSDAERELLAAKIEACVRGA